MRYIDADKFIKQFERALETQQKYGLYPHAEITQYVIKAIENEPTADVVPKSEVERLEHILNSYALQYGTVKDQHEVIDKAKSEVAKEIFEEIENMVSPMLGLEDDKEYVAILSKNFAELKKKYAEGDNEES